MTILAILLDFGTPIAFTGFKVEVPPGTLAGEATGSGARFTNGEAAPV